MKKYRIIEGDREVKELGNYKSVHYIECNKCEKVSPFAVKVDNKNSEAEIIKDSIRELMDEYFDL